MGVGRGHGKLLLFGEHAAVYGHPAVGIRLDDYLEVEIQEQSEAGWIVSEVRGDERRLIVTALSAVAGMVRDAPTSGRVTIRGTLPLGVGFGSSAAFCTALLRACGLASDGDTGTREFWRRAHELEHIFHGTPSGIDTGLSVYPGASMVEPRPAGLPHRTEIELPHAVLLAGAIPRTRSTAALVAAIRERRSHDAPGVEAAMARLGEYARKASSPALCPSAAELGRTADDAHELLAQLGLSTPALDGLLATLRRAGARGAKLSGAGGGGAFYGVFETAEEAEEAASAVRREHAQAGISYLRAFTLKITRR